jgi:serine protease AprX
LGVTTTNYRDDGNSAFIRSEDPDGFIGTSASTPIVSAALALLLEKNPQLTRQQVQQRIKDSTDKIGNVEYIEGHNPYYGYGKLNVGRLLE